MKCFENILFVSQPGGDDREVFARAVALTEDNQAKMTVVDVLDLGQHDESCGTSQDLSRKVVRDCLLEQRRQRLEELIAPARTRIEVQAKVLCGKPFLEIIRETLRNRRDLLVKAPRGEPGLISRIFGSTDSHLLRKSACPVWLVHPRQGGRYRRLLAAIDFRPGDPLLRPDGLNRRIVEMAAAVALAEFAELHIVHVWRAFGERELRSGFNDWSVDQVNAYVGQEQAIHETWLKNFLDQAYRLIGKEAVDYLRPKVHLLKGLPQTTIAELTSELEIDLVVMGSVDSVGIPGFVIGHTAEAVFSQIQCSLLAIKPAGFQTPVTL